MSLSKLSWAAAFAGIASAAPQISLPPLIPSIPGVTEILNDVNIPLPVLQIPTPALDSPTHAVNTTLRPKKIGHFWTGSGDKAHKDFLATYSLDDDTFGELLNIADVPSSGNEPHHSGKSRTLSMMITQLMLLQDLLMTESTSGVEGFFPCSRPRTLVTTLMPPIPTHPPTGRVTELFCRPSQTMLQQSQAVVSSTPTWALL
jgi:hypothetical protein